MFRATGGTSWPRSKSGASWPSDAMVNDKIGRSTVSENTLAKGGARFHTITCLSRPPEIKYCSAPFTQISKSITTLAWPSLALDSTVPHLNVERSQMRMVWSIDDEINLDNG